MRFESYRGIRIFGEAKDLLDGQTERSCHRHPEAFPPREHADEERQRFPWCYVWRFRVSHLRPG
jgi:hypothetical protein